MTERQNPELRPATREDVEAAFRHLYGVGEDVRLPERILAVTGRVGGKVIAVGGIVFGTRGARIAFCDISDEGRRYPLSLHRGAKMVLAEARKLGVKHIAVWEGPEVHEKTPGWLRHLGFERRLLAEGRWGYWKDLA